MRDSFIFYRSFYEAINDLPDDQQLEVYRAISEYSLNFKEPKLKGLTGTIFKLILPQLKANNARWENGKKGAEHGKKGGRPKTIKEPLDKPLDNPKETPSKTPNKNKNKNVNKNSNIPDLKEFGIYACDKIREILNTDPKPYKKAIALKYESWKENGWKDGNNRQIKNWKSKVLNIIPYLEAEEGDDKIDYNKYLQ